VALQEEVQQATIILYAYTVESYTCLIIFFSFFRLLLPSLFTYSIEGRAVYCCATLVRQNSTNIIQLWNHEVSFTNLGFATKTE
jgi:hypothetical protein